MSLPDVELVKQIWKKYGTSTPGGNVVNLPPLPAPDVTSLVSDSGEVYRSKSLYLPETVQAYALAAIAVHDAKDKIDAERWRKLLRIAFNEDFDAHDADHLTQVVDAYIEREGA